MHRALLDHMPQLDLPVAHVGRVQAEATVDENELAMAAEMLDRAQSGELDGFIVDLIDAASRSAGAPTLRAAGPLAKLLGRAAAGLWQADGGPQRQRAARAFGIELEGLSREDQAFELARHFVRFASDAADRVARSPSNRDPHATARVAARQAARTLAPGLTPLLAAPQRPFTPRVVGSPAPLSLARALNRPGFNDTTEEPVMHDIDRTQLEYTPELPGFESGSFNYEDSEFGNETGYLSEADEAELADELLAVSNEGELDQFLGSLIGKVAKGAGQFIRSPVGQAVGGVLKGVAKKALPLAGGALGGWVGGPLGAKIGSGLASAAGSALGLEGEFDGEGEGEQYEGAKQFVRLAADTVSKAASAPPSADPRAVAQRAAVSAARQLAPGLLGGQGGNGPGRPRAGSSARQGAGTAGAQSGRWARRGSKVVLYGL